MLDITIAGNRQERSERWSCADLDVEGVCPMWASPPPYTSRASDLQKRGFLRPEPDTDSHAAGRVPGRRAFAGVSRGEPGGALGLLPPPGLD
jgi:hypothetical protein